MNRMSFNIAHRGFSGIYPENTMLAFEKAIEAGCDGIETDVQLTKDGVAIICHDETIDRTTEGTGFIKDFTYEELKKINVKTKENCAAKNIKICTLEELLSLLEHKNIILNLELKNSIINYEGLEEIVIEKIYKYNLSKNIILSSFNHYSMIKCKEIDKEIKTGILYGCNMYKSEEYCKTVKADAIHPYFYSVDREVVKNAHKNNIMVNPYTIDDEEDMIKMIQLGVDGIITNYPDRLSKVLKGL